MDSRCGTGKYCTKPKSWRWSVSFFSYIMDTTRVNVKTLVTLRNWVNNQNNKIIQNKHFFVFANIRRRSKTLKQSSNFLNQPRNIGLNIQTKYNHSVQNKLCKRVSPETLRRNDAMNIHMLITIMCNSNELIDAGNLFFALRTTTLH